MIIWNFVIGLCGQNSFCDAKDRCAVNKVNQHYKFYQSIKSKSESCFLKKCLVWGFLWRMRQRHECFEPSSGINKIQMFLIWIFRNQQNKIFFRLLHLFMVNFCCDEKCSTGFQYRVPIGKLVWSRMVTWPVQIGSEL